MVVGSHSDVPRAVADMDSQGVLWTLTAAGCGVGPRDPLEAEPVFEVWPPRAAAAEA